MLEKILKEVVVSVVGKSSESIAQLLHSKKHVNEFLIAKSLNLTINQTRNILYKLADQGLVSSERKKDRKKGWFTYFWKIEVLKALEFWKVILQHRAEQITQQIQSRETKQFYLCERCTIEYSEENSLTHNFTCPECGNIFVLKDDTQLIKALRKNHERISQELTEVEEEIQKERSVIDKKRTQEIKKEVLEKQKKRAEARALRAKQKKPTLEKTKKLAKPKLVKKILKKSIPPSSKKKVKA